MSKEEKLAIAAATDGACSGNPGPGGWGALIRFQDGSEVEFGGFSPETTNNRMELKAAIKALEFFDDNVSLSITTDIALSFSAAARSRASSSSSVSAPR